MTIPPCQIYLITPPVIDDVEAFLPVLESALSAAPVACLQIRLKNLEDSALVQVATPICAMAQRFGVAVILNDRPDLVDPIGADGVHIGQEDMDYLSSRELLGGDAIIGVTCHNSKQLAFEAAGAGADYVAFGAFFETTTKEPKTHAELEILSWWQHAMETPVVAIGGITPDNAKSVIDAGADFIAVSAGVWAWPDGPAASVRLLSSLCLEPRSA
ncbi:thiamine-phosphate synthase [Algimonas arctica]|uniref:Thiamine-phosphate synthase n=1 Tax=Algimonas arctica TaxID=1479486 RepID=A0A8J3CQW7_9PROT|nr:thiamine phosphate synthase [Algimonas arctica]GHA96266.1 thiamine-phosphate synthase [Algimonas arctica]